MRRQFWFRSLLLGLAVCFGNVARAQVTLVKLNEVLASQVNFTNWEGNATDVLELFNTSFSPVDLGGCSLSDSNTAPLRYVFPVGGASVIPARGFYRLVFDSSGLRMQRMRHSASGPVADFSICSIPGLD